MAENILAAACENESRNAAKRMRLEAFHVGAPTLSISSGVLKRALTSCFPRQDEQIALDKPSGCGGALKEPSSLSHSAYSLAASAFSTQDATLYINGAGISYTYRGYPGLGAAMQHPVSLTAGTSQSNGKRRIQGVQSASFRSRRKKILASGCYRHFPKRHRTLFWSSAI